MGDETRLRKIVRTGDDEFMILKPTRDIDSWEKLGKRYDFRGIGNYVINEAKTTVFDLRDLEISDKT